MTLREKKCPYCKLYFQYEDGIDPHGVATTRNDSALNTIEVTKFTGFCPKCVDPHKISGMTYRKRTILSFMKKHLKEHGILTEYLDHDTLVGMLKQFPRSNQLYHSNGSYITFTLFPNSEFNGRHGKFKLGNIKHYKSEKNSVDRYNFNREITCLRCDRVTLYNIWKVLIFYLGIEEKTCINCDSADITANRANNSDYIKNFTGLNRNGSQKSEYSDRALSKALNVSRNDFRRHIITRPEPSLLIGTVINGLKIFDAYWDDDTYSPRYILFCERCQEYFDCVQKKVYQQQHWC